jgi:hypothetical protein
MLGVVSVCIHIHATWQPPLATTTCWAVAAERTAPPAAEAAAAQQQQQQQQQQYNKAVWSPESIFRSPTGILISTAICMTNDKHKHRLLYGLWTVDPQLLRPTSHQSSP